jgi:hypothetical protein
MSQLSETISLLRNAERDVCLLQAPTFQMNVPTIRLFLRATRRHIPEDGILHSHRRENVYCNQ